MAYGSNKSASLAKLSVASRRVSVVKVELILVRKSDAAVGVEVETVDLGERDLIPRIGETVFYRGLEYEVMEVGWDHARDSVSIGARY